MILFPKVIMKNKAPHDETYPEVNDLVTKINNMKCCISDYQKSEYVFNGTNYFYSFTILHFADVIRSFIIKSKNITHVQILIDNISIYENKNLHDCNELKIKPLTFGIPICLLRYSNIKLVVICDNTCDLKLEYLDLEHTDSYKLLHSGKLEFSDFVISYGACQFKTNKKLKN